MKISIVPLLKLVTFKRKFKVRVPNTKVDDELGGEVLHLLPFGITHVWDHLHNTEYEIERKILDHVQKMQHLYGDLVEARKTRRSMVASATAFDNGTTRLSHPYENDMYLFELPKSKMSRVDPEELKGAEDFLYRKGGFVSNTSNRKKAEKAREKKKSKTVSPASSGQLAQIQNGDTVTPVGIDEYVNDHSNGQSANSQSKKNKGNGGQNQQQHQKKRSYSESNLEV